MQHADLVIKRRDGVSPEPETLNKAKFGVENRVFVAEKMGRVNAHETTASRASSVLRVMDTLNAYKHADRLPIWSLWSRCVACGWMWQAWFVHHRFNKAISH